MQDEEKSGEAQAPSPSGNTEQAILIHAQNSSPQQRFKTNMDTLSQLNHLVLHEAVDAHESRKRSTLLTSAVGSMVIWPLGSRTFPDRWQGIAWPPTSSASATGTPPTCW